MTEQEVSCPKCGGRTWDNRASKRNPKAPDYKCRDKRCDGAIWPDKKGQPQARSTQVPSNPPSYGSVPGLDEQEQWEREQVAAIQRGASGMTGVTGTTDPFAKMAGLYARCLNLAVDNVPAACESAGISLTAEALVAATATLFIAAKERGLPA